jgi:hypothetical protein
VASAHLGVRWTWTAPTRYRLSDGGHELQRARHAGISQSIVAGPPSRHARLRHPKSVRIVNASALFLLLAAIDAMR